MRESIKREIIVAAAAALIGFGALAYLAKDAFSRDLDFACDVVRLRDADTWHCDGMVAAVRGWGFDAPDKFCGRRFHCRRDPKGAKAATAWMSALILGKRLQCEGKDFDRYGRVVARCDLELSLWGFPLRPDIGCMIIKAGHAIEMPYFSGGAYRECWR